MIRLSLNQNVPRINIILSSNKNVSGSNLSWDQHFLRLKIVLISKCLGIKIVLGSDALGLILSLN